MNKTRMTRKALLSSAVALFLCFAMLLGTTFAWFTDSVTSANNIIKSGNLDIELEYWNDGEWVDVNGKSDVLTNTLWEPGVTEVAYLRVANAGSLALKYQLGINIVSETAGVNAAGETFMLSDYIYFGVVESVNGETGAYADRDAAVAAVASAQNISAGYTKAAAMASGDELYLALVVYMPESVGNVANHNGTDIPEINLGINVVATQMTAEEDSFGSDYDNGAAFVTAPVERPATATDMNLKGANDVVISLPAEVINELPGDVEEIGMAVSDPVIDAANNTINYNSVELVDQNGKKIDLEALDLDAKITVTLPAQTVFAAGTTVIIYHDGEYMATATVNADTTISYKVDHLCEVSVSLPEAPKADATDANVINIGTAAELFGFAQNVNAGINSYEGKTVVLTADIDLKNAAWTPIGNFDYSFDGNFDGDNHKIMNLNISDETGANGYAYIGFFGVTANNTIENFKIENVTIESKGQIVAAAIAYPYYTTVNNITVSGNIAINGGNYTAGVLGYTRLCQNASNLTVSGNEGSYITGATTVGGVIADIQMNNGLVANYNDFSVSNVTISGNKCVGGIAGIIGGQTLNNATVTNVNLVCSDNRVGIVAGAFDTHPAINNATYSNVTGATGIVGSLYSSTGNSSIFIDGVEYVSVKNADELVAALENKSNVIFVNDIKIEPANMSNAYGTTGINVKYGQTIDGNGYTINIKGAGGTWDSGINTTGGLIKNLTVTGSYRGIFINHNSDYSEKVVLDNVVIGGNGTVYTISCDQGLYQGIEATNCTFNGWTSFAETAGEATFTNCTFGEGSGYKYCRPYSNTEFVNCTFCEGYAVDTTRATVTFTDCTGLN